MTVLGVARRVRWPDTALFRWARDRSYAWYLVHQPVVVAAAVVVIPTRLPLGAKVAAVFVLSLVGTIVATELLGRLAPTRVLIGLPWRPTRTSRSGGGEAAVSASPVRG